MAKYWCLKSNNDRVAAIKGNDWEWRVINPQVVWLFYGCLLFIMDFFISLLHIFPNKHWLMLCKHYVHSLLHNMTWFRIADESHEVNCRTGHELIEKWVVIIYFMTWFCVAWNFWCYLNMVFDVRSHPHHRHHRVWRKQAKSEKKNLKASSPSTTDIRKWIHDFPRKVVSKQN